MNDRPDSQRHAPSPSPHVPARWVLALLAVASVAVMAWPLLIDEAGTVIAQRGFLGADTHMRMVRVLDWVAGTDWYANASTRSNWPDGEVLHWTRPLDFLLVALAWVFRAFMGHSEAFFWAGVWVSPLLAIATLWVLLAASRRVLDGRGQVALIALFAFQPIARQYFSPARPDHHSLLLFLFTLALALVMVLLSRPAKPPTGPGEATPAGPAIALGLVLALAMWTSVEALVTAFFVFGALGLAWLVQGGGQLLVHLRRVSVGAAVALVVAMGIERPPDEWLTVVESDRLSVMQIVLFAAIAVAATGLWRARKAGITPMRRTVMAAAAAAFVLAVMGVFYPVFFLGPFGGAMAPELKAIWLEHIIEVNPLYDPDTPFTLGRTVRIAMPVMFIVGWAAWQWRQRPEPGARTQTVLLLAGGVMSLGLTAYQFRWGAYFAVLALMPWAGLIQLLLDWRAGPVVRVPAVVAVALAPIAGAVAVALSLDDRHIPPDAVACPWSQVIPVLDRMATEQGRPLVVFTQIHQGPEILYRSAHRVIGTPYHRNAGGIGDSFTVFAGADLARSRAILARRGVDVVAWCAGNGEARHHLRQAGDTLARRLEAGLDGDNALNWLEKIPLAADAGPIGVWRFRRDARP